MEAVAAWATVVLAAATIAMAWGVVWQARKTRDMARATNETAKATLEAQAKAAVFQELQVLLSLAGQHKQHLIDDGEAGKKAHERLKTLGLVDPSKVF